MTHTIRFFSLLAMASLVWQGCSGCDSAGGTPSWDGVNTDILSDGTGGDGTGSDTTWTDVPPAGYGSISGMVLSPYSIEGQFPISGALVWVTKTPPDAIPAGVYCHSCEEMPETVPHTFSAPDGTFAIGNISEGTWDLVVQKGEFRRIRQIEVTKDVNLEVPTEYTTFPDVHAPDAMDWTPSIAVALGSFDDMQDILAKIGLCDVDGDHHAILESCDHIDFYDNGGGYDGEPEFESLLRDLEQMRQYHIIFVPCSSSMTDDALGDPAVANNIRQWVDEGGKWYVADWSYDHVEQIFPDFIDFEGDDSTVGSADMASTSFDTTGRAVNADLRAWVEASLLEPADSLEFIENWDCIEALGAVPGTDPDTGDSITVVPETYCEGSVTRSSSCMSPAAPLTLTFPYGCGKVLYTTYHTVGEMSSSHAGLHTQEKILVYMILEIGLCTEPVTII